MTFHEACPYVAVGFREFPVVIGATIMTSHEGVLFANVHLHWDKCLNALGQVFAVLVLIVHGRVMLD